MAACRVTQTAGTRPLAVRNLQVNSAPPTLLLCYHWYESHGIRGNLVTSVSNSFRFRQHVNHARTSAVGTVTAISAAWSGDRILPIPVPRGLGRRSVGSRLVGLRVRIPPGAWMFVSCFVSTDKRQNAGHLKTQVRINYRVYRRIQKKFPYSKRALFSPKTSPPTSLLYNGHGGSFRGVGGGGSVAGTWTSSLTEVKNEWSFISLLTIYLHGVDRVESTFHSYKYSDHPAGCMTVRSEFEVREAHLFHYSTAYRLTAASIQHPGHWSLIHRVPKLKLYWSCACICAHPTLLLKCTYHVTVSVTHASRLNVTAELQQQAVRWNLPLTEPQSLELFSFAGRFVLIQLLELWIIANPDHWMYKNFPLKTGYYYAQVSRNTGFTACETQYLFLARSFIKVKCNETCPAARVLPYVPLLHASVMAAHRLSH